MEQFDRQKTIETIIRTEWDMFQQTDNIGGRASCQDDPETFYIMRASQYENWTDSMLSCWASFLEKSKNEGRNLVTKKYGRMMQYTDLHYYNKYLKGVFPAVSQPCYRLINTIVPQLIAWEQEFAAAWPKLADVGRPITSDGDASGFTSMETYARGELETYPEELLRLYADYVADLKAAGKSLSVMNQQTMVSYYGYDSIEEAEASLA